MPEEKITIGGKTFEVACQAGEEQFLHAAAGMLDAEAQALIGQIGRLPEARMLLMSGLMLADKTAGYEDRLRAAEEEIERLRAENSKLRSAPRPAQNRVEVPVVPQEVAETMAELAARAEALADQIDERA
ncbi:cell division protein ZapA [Pararhodobacter sp. SW119]|uniref:cell division protein ZapA n=1 Tax=Pararhodobacter sp. SW119 TaxID=2780075 RepID=UPI001AE032EA|nr:cell division protein ZapA [Pararhodobacter sp. SW119]